MQILRIASHSNLKEHSSPHNLLAKYHHLKGNVSKVHVCPEKKCPLIFSINDKLKRPFPEENQRCGHKFSTKSSNNCFILRLPIKQQIAYFLQHHGLRDSLRSDPALRGDVSLGGCYLKLRNQGIIDDFTVTMQLNTDGAEGFQTSKYGFWPLMGIINEAQYKLRRNYIILMSL